METWTVYRHINKINNKIYVGITKNSVAQRWGKNGRGYKPSQSEHTCFYKAIQKYGWNNFEHEILFEGLTYELAIEKEKELIKLYNCKAPFGYNLTDGGEGTSGIEVSEKVRKKRSQNMSGNNNIKAKKVFCDGKIFDTINDCADYLGVNRNKLVRWITGETIIPKDILDKNPYFIGESPNYKICKQQTPIIRTQVIFQGRIFPSVAECARFLNIDKGTLDGWLHGIYGISKPYQWLLDTDLCIYGQEQKIRYPKSKERNNNIK